MSPEILQAFLTLSLIVLALGGVLLLVKKFVKKTKSVKGSFGIQVVSKTALSPKNSLFVIKVEDKTLLIGATDHNITTLKDLSESSLPVAGNIGQNLPSAQNRNLLKPKMTSEYPPSIQRVNHNLNRSELEKQLTFGAFLKSAFSKQ